MSAKKLLLAIFFIAIIVSANSQNSTYTIVDAGSKFPVPYASIKVKNTKIQRVANSDGRFELPLDLFSTHDSIIISCVGYHSQTIPVKNPPIPLIIKLVPITYQLTTFDLVTKGNLDYPYQLFADLCIKYRKFDFVSHTKGYFSFLSQFNSTPLEIIEGYFNTDASSPNGIIQARLKNGRIGLCLNSFYSLNTTDILTHFTLFSTSSNLNLPSSAGNFTFHRLKRLYDVRIISTSTENGSKKFILQFLARKDSATLFSGMAWINYTEKTIEKLEYFVKTNDFCYLRPVIKGDKTDSIEVFLEFTFDNSDKDHPVISQASLNYSFLYSSLSQANTIKITSEGNFIFYDFANQFPETFPSGLVEEQHNDYQKISCLPYDSVFWTNPGITPQSDKQKLFIDFFKTQGVLINFSKTLDSLAGSNYIRWSSASFVDPAEIRNKPQLTEPVQLRNGETKFFVDTSQTFDINCKLLFNPVILGDSLHLSSVTLLNKHDSYYFISKSFQAAVFINLVFDLNELGRREIMEKCNSMNKGHKLTLPEFQEIYSKGLIHLRDTINVFKLQTDNGRNAEAMERWYKTISVKTGTDRSLLIKGMEYQKGDGIEVNGQRFPKGRLKYIIYEH